MRIRTPAHASEQQEEPKFNIHDVRAKMTIYKLVIFAKVEIVEVVSNILYRLQLDLDCSGRLRIGVELCNHGLIYKGTRGSQKD